MDQRILRTFKRAWIPCLLFAASCWGSYAIYETAAENTSYEERELISRQSPHNQSRRAPARKSSKNDRQKDKPSFKKKDYDSFMKKLGEGLTAKEYEQEYVRLLNYEPLPSNIYGILLKSWGEHYPREGIRFLEEGLAGREEKRKWDIYALVDSWGNKEPEEAYQYYTENKGKFPPRLILKTINHWAGKDHAAAWEAMGKMTPAERAEALDHFFAGLAANSPQNMGIYAKKLSDTGNAILSNNITSINDWTLGLAADTWIKNDPDSARVWIDSLSGGNRDIAERLWAGYLAENALPLTKEDRETIVAALGNSLYFSSPIISEIAGRLGYEKGLNWFLDNEFITPGDNKFESYVTSWSRRDLKEVQEWISRLPEGTARDSAIANYLFVGKPYDHETQLSLAMSVGNEDQKKKALKYAAKSWYEENPAEAAEWLATAPFTEKEKQKITETESYHSKVNMSYGRSD